MERDFASFQHFFKTKFEENPDHFINDHSKHDLIDQKLDEHDGLLNKKFLNNEQIHEDFLEKNEDIHNFLKKLLNKFFKALFEKHFNHNHIKELIKNPIINHLDDDCKNSLKLLISKCLETVENKDCFNKLLELPLKDVFDEENMIHLHNLFDDHENKKYILDYLLKLPLNAVLNHKIKEHIFEKDLLHHEDILEDLLKLPLTDIFEIKEHLVVKDIHSAIEHTHEDKDDLLKFLVSKHIVEEEVKKDMSKNVLEALLMKLMIAKNMLIKHELTKILKETIERSVKDHINHDEQFAVKALLAKLGEDILMKSILKEWIEHSVKDHINYDQQLVVKVLLTKLAEDIMVKSIIKETVEHSQLNEKKLVPKPIEENVKMYEDKEVKEKLLKLMFVKYLLSHQNKPEEVPVQKDDTNENPFKRNDDINLDFDKLKKELQKTIISEQANPVETTHIFDSPVSPVESSCVIDIPANPVESYIIDIPANPEESFIIDTPENVKNFDKYSDPGLWDYYYNQYAHFIKQETDEEICIGCDDDDENVYYPFEQ